MKVGAKIRALRKARKMTIKDLAIQTNSDVGNISRLERDIQGFSNQLLSKIAAALCVPVSELFNNEKSAQDIRDLSMEKFNFRVVPLISWVQATAFFESGIWESPNTNYDSYACPNPNAGARTFALTVRGDSMTGFFGGRSYPEGTIIFVDPDHPVSSGQRVVACLKNRRYSFKELAENEMGEWYLKALNPRFSTSEQDRPSKVGGVVIGAYLPE